MAIILSSIQKRVRSEDDDEVSPTKRNKVQLSSMYAQEGMNEMMMFEEQPQVANGGHEQGQGEMEVEMMDDSEEETQRPSHLGGDTSNPLHPWNAPRMLHQVSTNSLSSTSSSAPGTPLDNTVFPDQYTHQMSFPTSHNPTSFTDQNGVTRSFPSPALSPYPPSPQHERDDPTAVADYINKDAATRGSIHIVNPAEAMNDDEMGLERELISPRYNWDLDRPAYAIGGYLV